MDTSPIQYARTDDGVNIAYQEVGDGPPALLLHPLPASHLTLDWDIPTFRRTYELCARSVRLIRYDPRQCGLSEDAKDLSLPAFVSDVRSVQAAVGRGSIALIAIASAAPVAIGFAATHGDQVSSLVLLGPVIDYDQRIDVERSIATAMPDRADVQLQRLINPAELGEDDVPLHRVVLHNQRRFGELGPPSEIGRTMARWDMSDLVSTVACPTLVVDFPDRVFSTGPDLARRLSNAEMITRGGSSGPLLNPDLDGLIGLVLDFVLGHPPEASDTEGAATASSPDDNAAMPAGSFPAGLTPRELDVLRLIALGRTNAEIADALVIRPSTVSRHVHHILVKTKAHNRAGAVTWAFANRILQD